MDMTSRPRGEWNVFSTSDDTDKRKKTGFLEYCVHRSVKDTAGKEANSTLSDSWQ